MKHDMDKGSADGLSTCKQCGQVEGLLDCECPGPPFDEPAQTINTKSKSFTTGPCFEYIPDRYAIATNLAAGMIASGQPRYHSDELVVADAVALTDKLIARVKETQK